MSRIAVVVLYGGMILASSWFLVIQPLRTARRCHDLGAASSAEQPTGSQEARLAPSDAEWYAEHCAQGKPRRD
jgi:hypothetical protein